MTLAKSWLLGILIAVLVVAGAWPREDPLAVKSSAQAGEQQTAITAVQPDAPQTRMDEAARVLVVAPHPDDDILGVGGAIASFREQGLPVLVVFLTSGDGSQVAQWLLGMGVAPFTWLFQAIGALRQKEAVAALYEVGVSPSSCLFLNYPDQGLTALLEPNWPLFRPFRSPYTGKLAKYSRVVFDPCALYCGEALLADLKAIIGVYRPTVVYLPHPLDVHPDHRAGHTFASRAIAELAKSDPDFATPTLRCYLVHPRAGQYARDIQARVSLDASLRLGTWYSTPLTPAQMDAKQHAVRAHVSQWGMSLGALGRFVSSSELYMVESP